MRIIRDPFTGRATEMRMEVPQPFGPPLYVPIRLPTVGVEPLRDPALTELFRDKGTGHFREPGASGG